MNAEERWKLNYKLLVKYKEEHGNIDIPFNYLVNDIQLGRWLGTQRNMYKENKLSEERINKLNDLGMNWNVIDKYYVLLEEYKEEHGNIDVPTYYEVNGIKLGQWIRRMRAKYHLNKLDNINIEKLNELGMCWRVVGKLNEKGITISHPEIKTKWDYIYNFLVKYKEEYGNIDVPTQYVVDNIQLGRWLGTQRNMYKENKLSEERIKKLNKLGMNWDVIDKYYVLLEEYKEKHGNIDVPTNYEINGIKLGEWVRRMRDKYNKNKLDNINTERLNNLGMSWRIYGVESYSKYIDLLIKYKEEHGNIDVPINYEINGIKLGAWLKGMRIKYNKNELDNIYIEKLNNLGMNWRMTGVKSYNKHIELLETYKEEHGNIDVPTNYLVNDIQLGRWLGTQRILYKENKLSEERINELNKLGMNWDVIDKYYVLLEEYKEKHGNIDVPTYYKINGIKLGNWVRRMRDKYNKNELDDINIERLNKLGIDWSPKDTKLLNKEVNSEYKEKYQLLMYKRLQSILRDLQLENINEIHNEEEQKEIEKTILKRLFR